MLEVRSLKLLVCLIVCVHVCVRERAKGWLIEKKAVQNNDLKKVRLAYWNMRHWNKQTKKNPSTWVLPHGFLALNSSFKLPTSHTYFFILINSTHFIHSFPHSSWLLYFFSYPRLFTTKTSIASSRRLRLLPPLLLRLLPPLLLRLPPPKGLVPPIAAKAITKCISNKICLGSAST